MNDRNWCIWNQNDRSTHIQVIQQFTLSYVGPGKSENDAASIRTVSPIPPSVGIFYWEMRVVNKGRDGHIGIGIGTSHVSLNRLPGWESQSIGWHGDDGYVFVGSGNGSPFGPCYSSNDVVGCGIDFANEKIFFTHNAVVIGYLTLQIHGFQWFPMVGFRTPGEQVCTNFEGPFEFDLNEYIKRQKFVMQSKISGTPLFSFDISVPTQAQCKAALTSVQLKEIILEWLLSHGFLNTSVSFFHSAVSSSVFENILNASIVSPKTNEFMKKSITEKVLQEEVELVTKRKEIVQLVMNGKVAECLKRLDKKILIQNKSLAFRLHTQHFIELIRVYYETSEFTSSSCTVLQKQINEILEWGAFLAKEYPHEPLLNSLFCLVAYKSAGNNCQSAQWALFLLKPEVRAEVARLLNTAILDDQQKSQTTRLENLLQQAYCVCETLKNVDGSTALIE